MNISVGSMHVNRVSVALAAGGRSCAPVTNGNPPWTLAALGLLSGALVMFGSLAHAAELDPITVSKPAAKIVGHDDWTRAPVEDVTVKAQIAVDSETLLNDSGIVLLKDRVREAAFKACREAESFVSDDEDCVRRAVKSARPQIAAAIADAKAQANAQERLG